MKIFAVNPGSTSTKIAVFEDEKIIFSQNVVHPEEELEKYKEIRDQLPYREATIRNALTEAGFRLEEIDAYVGRAAGMKSLDSGVYEIDELVVYHGRIGADGLQHPAHLGGQIVYEYAKKYQKPAFFVNAPVVNELQDVARLTGIEGVYRNVHLHALNLKETAIRHAENMGKKYEDCNFVVCHIGGGISVSAHRKGRMVDGNDIMGGEGPIAPTRCGAVPAEAMIKLCFSGKYTEREIMEKCTKNGGFMNLLGISDAAEVCRRIENGDKYAELVWNAMIYQITKEIGAMSAVLHGEVDGILLGGGMVRDEKLVKNITEACSFIAPVTAYPGEFEMEAMAAGVLRVLSGQEKVKKYTGKPNWDGFHLEGCEDPVLPSPYYSDAPLEIFIWEAASASRSSRR